MLAITHITLINSNLNTRYSFDHLNFIESTKSITKMYALILIFIDNKTIAIDLDETLIHSEPYDVNKQYDHVIRSPGNSLGIYVRPHC